MEQSSDPVYKDDRFGKNRELLYKYDENGKFIEELVYHGEPDRIAIQQAWDFVAERVESARQKVKSGKASPIAFYMEKIFTNPRGLSMMTGVPLILVKLHLRPSFFNRLPEKTLKKYAEAFQIPVEQLKKVD